MSEGESIRSLQHDIRGLNQTLLSFSGSLGSLAADQKALSAWVQSIDKTVGELRDSVTKAKGGWIVLTTLAAGAGTLGALLTKWFHP